MYGASSGDYGTLGFFRNKLNRIAVTKEPKKDVNATLDFLDTVIKGHWLACACNVLGITSLDDPVLIPAGLSGAEQEEFVERIARKVVDKVTLVESSFQECDTPNTANGIYNYARILCHFGSLSMEFRDAWREGDGERIVRCWKLFLPHFKADGRHKYALEALRLLFQVNVVLSPNLAYQVMWHRFVNVSGGLGRNIPCDLHNEHMNRLIKFIITNMGSNLTEDALQNTVRSVSTLDALCHKFDRESGVPYGTSAHSTKPDDTDVKKVVSVILQQGILTPTDGRAHKAFPNLHLDPLDKWDIEDTKAWIETKKEQYLKYRNKFRSDYNDDEDNDNCDDDDGDDEDDGDDGDDGACITSTYQGLPDSLLSSALT